MEKRPWAEGRHGGRGLEVSRSGSVQDDGVLPEEAALKRRCAVRQLFTCSFPTEEAVASAASGLV